MEDGDDEQDRVDATYLPYHPQPAAVSYICLAFLCTRWPEPNYIYHVIFGLSGGQLVESATVRCAELHPLVMQESYDCVFTSQIHWDYEAWWGGWVA